MICTASHEEIVTQEPLMTYEHARSLLSHPPDVYAYIVYACACLHVRLTWCARITQRCPMLELISPSDVEVQTFIYMQL